MKNILCNTDKPSLIKLAILTNNKVTSIHSRATKNGIKTHCKFNDKLMTTPQALKEIHTQMNKENIVLINHSGYPISYKY